MHFDPLKHGVEGSMIIPNPYLTRTWSKYKAFVEEGKKCANCTDEQYTVRKVFHGTASENVDYILEHGLDQNRRTGQIHGQGEYFASNAAMSSVYCQGGNRMLAVAVLCRDIDIRCQHGTQGVVVVKESSRLLPLGSLTFAALTATCTGRVQASTFQLQLYKLKEQQQKLEQLAKEAKEKEKIIRRIMDAQYDIASEYYNRVCNRNGGEPLSSWADEVSCYMRDHIRDGEMVAIYFPNLPERPMVAKDVQMLEQCEYGVWKESGKLMNIWRTKLTTKTTSSLAAQLAY